MIIGGIDYTKLYEKQRRHHRRWRRRVEERTPRLVCQECGGSGGETEVILDDGTGPWMECGWCEGIGYVDGHRRGEWMRYKKTERKDKTVENR